MNSTFKKLLSAALCLVMVAGMVPVLSEKTQAAGALAAPTGLTATFADDAFKNIELKWNAISGATNYEIQYHRVGKDAVDSWIDEGMSSSNKYTATGYGWSGYSALEFHVRAENASGDFSQWSSSVTISFVDNELEKEVTPLAVEAYHQSTESSCGQAATKAVLRYFGKALDKTDTELFPNAVSVEGRTIKNKLNEYLGADYYSFSGGVAGFGKNDAEASNNILECIRSSLNAGNPVIVLIVICNDQKTFFPWDDSAHNTIISGLYKDSKDKEWVEITDSYSYKYSANLYRNPTTGKILIPYSELLKYMGATSKTHYYLVYSIPPCPYDHSAGGKQPDGTTWTYRTASKDDGTWTAICKNENCKYEYAIPELSGTPGVYKGKSNAADGEISNSPYKEGKKASPAANTKYTISGSILNAYGNTWCQIADGTWKDHWINADYLELYYTALNTSDAGTYEVIDGDSTDVCSEPYSGTSVACSGKTLTVVGSVINAYGNKWYQLNSGKWVFSGKVRLSASSDAITLDMSTFAEPIGLVENGGGLTLHGIVSSAVSNLTSVSANVYNSDGSFNTGKTVTSVGAKQYDLNKIDAYVRFDLLKAGTYRYEIVAKNAGHPNGVQLYNKTFTVSPKGTATYTISYNANGGSGAPAAQTKIHNTAVPLSSTIPKFTGYNFKGWAESASATEATYQPGDSFTKNSNTTLYAVWKMKGPSVTTRGSSVTVSWLDVTNETGYGVYLIQSPWGTADIKYSKTDLPANTTTYTFTNVANGEYCAYVIAQPNTRKSDWVGFTVNAAIPTNLTASTNKSAYLLGETVIISISADNATKYAVSIWDGGAFNTGNRVYNSGYSETGSFSYTPRAAGTFDVRHQAENDTGVVISTDTVFTVVSPSLSAQINTDGNVRLDWDFAPSDAGWYWVVYRNTENSFTSANAIARPSGKLSYWTDTTTEPGTRYFYKIQPIASDGSWNGGYTNIVEVSTPQIITVTFNANGGTGTMDVQTVTDGSNFVLPACTFTAPVGQRFGGWLVNGTKHAPGYIFTPTADITVTAIWEDIIHVEQDSDGAISWSVAANEFTGKGIVAIATYDINGKLLETTVIEVADLSLGADGTALLPTEGDGWFKVFLLNGQTFAPLIQAQSANTTR